MPQRRGHAASPREDTHRPVDAREPPVRRVRRVVGVGDVSAPAANLSDYVVATRASCLSHSTSRFEAKRCCGATLRAAERRESACLPGPPRSPSRSGVCSRFSRRGRFSLAVSADLPSIISAFDAKKRKVAEQRDGSEAPETRHPQMPAVVGAPLSPRADVGARWTGRVIVVRSLREGLLDAHCDASSLHKPVVDARRDPSSLLRLVGAGWTHVATPRYGMLRLVGRTSRRLVVDCPGLLDAPRHRRPEPQRGRGC